VLVDDGQAEDLYDLIREETARDCERKWREAMEDERAKMKQKDSEEPVSVWKLIYKCMGRKFMLGSLNKVLWLVAVVLQVRNQRHLMALVFLIHISRVKKFKLYTSLVFVFFDLDFVLVLVPLSCSFRRSNLSLEF